MRLIQQPYEKIAAFFNRLPGRIRGRVNRKRETFFHAITPIWLACKASGFAQRIAQKKPHGLSAPLVISLTSYPARFDKLPLTIKCLLTQSMAADHVILWVAHGDKSALTQDILDLQSKGLEIAYCEDIRSFKKIVPTLKRYPESFVVTADDDLYYWPTWLEELVRAYTGNLDEAICHRAHRIRLSKKGLPMPYREWERETQSLEPSPLIFPTSGAGVLYPPGIFHGDAVKKELFMRLCPQADDIWLYWMIRINSRMARKIGTRRKVRWWQDTQQVALYHYNEMGGGNDRQINAMVREYGSPFYFGHN